MGCFCPQGLPVAQQSFYLDRGHGVSVAEVATLSADADGPGTLYRLSNPGVDDKVGQPGGSCGGNAQPGSGDRGCHDVVGHRGLERRDAEVSDGVVRSD
jgi:hypothetical protein